MAYTRDHALDFTIPQGKDAERDAEWHPIYLRHLANPKYNPALKTYAIRERSHTYGPLPWHPEFCRMNVVFHGYFQTEKYFAHHREGLIQAFGFPWKLLNGAVSVHVRRGDYLTIQKYGVFKHPPVPKRWIEEQMEKFPGHGFIFFSDDLEWCRKEFGHRRDCSFGDMLPMLPFDGDTNDLVHGSMCEHHICSASTFSWWQAWLNQNPNKRVIMPAHWINPQWSDIDCSDIVPAGWERYAPTY
jgi:hypothetical protein